MDLTRERSRRGVAIGPVGGILFDKDGTLLDYAATWGPINLSAARIAAGGSDVEAARLLRLVGGDPATGHAIADTLLAAGTTPELAAAWADAGSPVDREALTERLDDLFRSSVGAAVPVTDLAALFARLKRRGVRLGIASSDNAAAVAATAERFGLDDHVDFLAGYDSGHGSKPSAGMLAAFCAATGVPAAAAVVVGDNLHDIEMGRRGGAGLTVGVLTGTGTPTSLGEVADVVLDSIEGLEPLLFGAVRG